MGRIKWLWPLFFALSSAAGEQRLVILTPHTDAIRYEFGAGFARWHEAKYGEAAEVEWRNVGGTSDSLRYLHSEFARKPAGVGVDLFFGGGQEPYLLLSDEHLLHRYEPPPEVMRGIAPTINGAEIYGPSFQWFGACLSSFGILQNTRVQRAVGLPMVREWIELTNGALFGWVGAGDPRNSGTMSVMFEGFLQSYGWEAGWHCLTQIGGNVRQFDRLSSSTAKDVTLGETAYAFSLDFYGFTQVTIGGRSNLAFVLPKDFTAVNADGLAILVGAPHLETARRFVDFVLSESGQKLWFLPRGHPEGPQRYSIEHMSIRPDFYERYKGVSNIEYSPFSIPQTFRFNARLARDRRDILPALLGALLVDTHAELRAAWRQILQRGGREADLRALGTVPLTENDLLKMAQDSWKDATFRNRKKIEWQTWAQEKYRRLAAGQLDRGGP